MNSLFKERRSIYEKQTWSILSGGVAAMMIAMGIRGFAFTPILPITMDHHLFSASGAGYLASGNYLGYLIGAFVLTSIQVKNRSVLLFAGLIISIGTTWGMGNSTVWRMATAPILVRLASASVFVIVTSIVMERLSALQAGIFYGGVGAGILLTGNAVPLLAHSSEWIGIWKGLGLSSLVLGMAVWYSLGERNSGTVKASHSNHLSVRRILVCLTIAYGLEGLGYIVQGTYLVAYAKTVSSIPNMTSFSWMLVGATAIAIFRH